MSTTAIRPEMTMEEILQQYPSARRALFQRYHVGGCSSCGFQPTDTLAQVCRDHNILDVDEVVRHLQRSHEVDQRMQVDAAALQEWLAAGEGLRVIDVRPPGERAGERLDWAEPLDFGDTGKYMQLPRDTRIVFVCTSGLQSLDVAAYFAGHGFTQAFALKGGLESWRARGALGQPVESRRPR